MIEDNGDHRIVHTASGRTVTVQVDWDVILVDDVPRVTMSTREDAHKVMEAIAHVIEAY